MEKTEKKIYDDSLLERMQKADEMLDKFEAKGEYEHLNYKSWVKMILMGHVDMEKYIKERIEEAQ